MKNNSRRAVDSLTRLDSIRIKCRASSDGVNKNLIFYFNDLDRVLHRNHRGEWYKYI